MHCCLGTALQTLRSLQKQPSRTNALKPPGFCDLPEHVSNSFQLREFLNMKHEIRQIYTLEDLAVFWLLLFLPHFQGWDCIKQGVLLEELTLAQQNKLLQKNIFSCCCDWQYIFQLSEVSQENNSPRPFSTAWSYTKKFPGQSTPQPGQKQRLQAGTMDQEGRCKNSIVSHWGRSLVGVEHVQPHFQGLAKWEMLRKSYSWICHIKEVQIQTIDQGPVNIHVRLHNNWPTPQEEKQGMRQAVVIQKWVN